MDEKREFPNCKGVSKILWHLQCQVTISLKKDWLVKVAEEVKVAVASSNSEDNLSSSVTPGRRILVTATMCDKNDKPIHGKQQRLNRGAANFNEQFSYSPVNVFTPIRSII